MTQPLPSWTRRRFLAASGTLFGTGLGWPRALLAAGARPVRPRSVVVRAESDLVANAEQIRLVVLEDQFDGALRLVGRADSIRQAWLRFLSPDDIIGINFNPYGGRRMGIDRPLAMLIVRSLIRTGWPPEHIVLRGAPQDVVTAFGTRTPRFGWSETPVRFGGFRDQLSSFVDQVSAIINVPLLKDDNILGLSCCLKNLTYGLLKHPARFHDDGGAALAEVLEAPGISGKLRLNIVNGLRSVYDRGPLVDRAHVVNSGLLLMGTDPVAVDAVALDRLNALRQTHDLPPRSVPLMEAAVRRGLGHADFRRIQRLSVAL